MPLGAAVSAVCIFRHGAAGGRCGASTRAQPLSTGLWGSVKMLAGGASASVSVGASSAESGALCPCPPPPAPPIGILALGALF